MDSHSAKFPISHLTQPLPSDPASSSLIKLNPLCLPASPSPLLDVAIVLLSPSATATEGVKCSTHRKMAASITQKHFVLVHGAGHGAWCWYKIKPRLESAGHKVTALDNAGSGINTKSIEDVHSLEEYTEPVFQFLGSLGAQEKVILVGHSLGGMNLSIAMEKFPEKISVAVFLTAFMPDTTHHPGYIVDEFQQRTPPGEWLDTQFGQFGEELFTSFHFGPKILAELLYQLSPIEDLELARSLVRKSCFFQEQVCKMKNFTDQGYGSVTRVFVVCGKDLILTKEYQHWMIQNSGIKDVVEIEGADHMPMFSKPEELSNSLLEIAQKYS